MFRVVFCCLAGFAVQADEPSAGKPSSEVQPPTGEASSDQATVAFQLSDDVRKVIMPLFSSITEANVSRATVEMSAHSKMNGVVLESLESTYQIASIRPDHFTIYLKEPEQRTRIFCDGQDLVVAVATDSFIRLSQPISNQDAVTSLPVPLGPYPEVVLALTLAGVDPAVSLLDGMKSIDVVDQEKFGDEIPTVHLRGVQGDEVTEEDTKDEGGVVGARPAAGVEVR